jgi:heme/copper-type cytochrome/quinol oxidase subunit 4
MSFAFAGSATSFATTVLSYFSPSKSPFYGVIAFATVSSLLACDELETIPWLWVAIPTYAVLAICTKLSFRNRTSFLEGEGEEQLKFARSFSLSSCIITFVLTARETQHVNISFWANYAACISQITVFLLYTWARSESSEEQKSLNFVQFALVTATLLIGASYGNAQYASAVSQKVASSSAEHYFITATGLYLLWACLLFIWIRHLMKLIKIYIPHDQPPEEKINK